MDVPVHDLRDFTTDRHRVVDDVPYGGGPGMVLKPEPLFRAVEHIRATRGTPGAVVLTSPQGRVLTQAEAARLAALEHLVVLCGRYEGVDERVRAARRDRGNLDRRLRAERRRTGGDGDHRRRQPAGAGRGG